MLFTLTLSEPHEIQRIENSVEEKMGIEKNGERDINLWLHSLKPLLFFVTFVMNSFPLPKRCTLNGLVEYECFKSFLLKWIHGNHPLVYFKPRAFNIAKKWNSATTMWLFSLLNKDLQRSVLTIHGQYLFKSLECFHSCLNMFCFVHHWKNKLKLDWVHISANRNTYLVSLIASLVFKETVFLKFIFI